MSEMLIVQVRPRGPWHTIPGDSEFTLCGRWVSSGVPVGEIGPDEDHPDYRNRCRICEHKRPLLSRPSFPAAFRKDQPTRVALTWALVSPDFGGGLPYGACNARLGSRLICGFPRREDGCCGAGHPSP